MEKTIYYKAVMETGQKFEGLALHTNIADGALMIDRVDGRELKLLMAKVKDLKLEPRWAK